MAQGDYGTQRLFGVPIGYLEGANPSIRFPLFVDYSSASGLKVRAVDGGALWLAPSTDAPARDALVTISLANAAGREWRVLNLDGVRLTQAKLDSGAWALVVVDAADASAANYRTTTVDGGAITTVFTGTGDYRALLASAAADVSTNPRVLRLFGGLVAFNSTNGGFALLGSGVDPNAALDASIRSKLTSYWRLDEASGTRADSIGSNNLTANGTGGVGSTTGKIGNAAAFVGAESDYLSIADNASVSIGNNSCEFFFWVYSSGSLASAIEIVSKRNDYIIQINSAGAFFTGWFGGVTKIATKSVALSINTAYFISAAFDKDTQEISIDVNNSGTRGTTATTSSTMDDGTGALAFGGRPFGSAFLTGWMDEIGYAKAATMTPAERTRIFGAGAAYNGFLP